MKITKNTLKRIIKEEMQRVLQESEGWFDWPDVEALISETHPEGGPAYDLDGLLNNMGSLIRDSYGFDTRDYDMDSMDLASDIVDNYEDELRAAYPDLNTEDAIATLDGYLR